MQEHAKKMQVKTVQESKPKVKLFDINMKTMEYSSEMMSKIARNTGNLSKIIEKIV